MAKNKSLAVNNVNFESLERGLSDDAFKSKVYFFDKIPWAMVFSRNEKLWPVLNLGFEHTI